jgi:hypothetical protein
MLEVGGLLRAEGRHAAGGGRAPVRSLVALVALAGFVHGAAMGSYGGTLLQPLFSGLKVPLFLAVSTLVCLPSVLVLNTVLGLRDDLGAALRAVLAAQATLAVALASLAPLVLVFYLSVADYRTAVVANGALFALATLAGQTTLDRHYTVLVARDPRHRIARRVWLVLYVFVAIQAAWVLRPFVGRPGLPSQFLRDDPWSNAYVVVARYVWAAWRHAVE